MKNAIAASLLASLGLSAGLCQEVVTWNADSPWADQADPLFQNEFTSGATPWINALEHGSVVHLLFGFPSQIQRYDMQAQAWLSTISLPSTPTAMAIDDDGIYVAFSADIWSYSLDGSGGSLLYTAPAALESLLVDGGLLFAGYDDKLISIDKTTGALLDSEDYFYGMIGLSISAPSSKIYARSTGISPSDILEIQYMSDGTLGTQEDSPYHGDYPTGDRTWVHPLTNNVSDNTGLVYTSVLNYGGSLAGPFTDLAVDGDGFVVLRGNTLFAHGSDFLETGRATTAPGLLSIFVHDGFVYGFSTDTNGAAVTTLATSSLVPLNPGPPTNPLGLPFTPDQVIMGDEGTLYLLSISDKSVFRWSKGQLGYLPTIPLAEEPDFLTYSAPNNAIYLAYESGRITVVDASELSDLSETSFVNSPQTPCGLSMAGEWLFVCDPSGAWVSHFTYSPNGELVSQKEWNYYSEEYVWSATNGRMYHLRDQTSPNDLLWEQIDEFGVLGADLDSPLHSSLGMTHPIRLPTSGQIVILGSGRFHDAITLDLLNELGVAYVDAAFVSGQLVTLHQVGNDSELRYWNDFLTEVVDTVSLPGEPLAVRENQSDLIVVTSPAGTPQFSVIEGSHPIFEDGFESGDTTAW
ncbi:MAG: hypothetical protein K8J08_02715 [Thermoanaerobaculia bacterium]|nr:hypothetical protein [Thermoanaerobaculia bacterium]